MRYKPCLTAKQLKDYLLKIEETVDLDEVEVIGYTWLTRTKATGAKVTWMDFSNNDGEDYKHRLNLQTNPYYIPLNAKGDVLELEVLVAILDTVNELTNNTYRLTELRDKLLDNNIEVLECKLVVETIVNDKLTKCTVLKDFTNIFKLYDLELNEVTDILVKYLLKYKDDTGTELVKYLID